jgi:(4S)-4-hydroxy-5-phosphonooxypentane-2,3-dione isomerase
VALTRLVFFNFLLFHEDRLILLKTDTMIVTCVYVSVKPVFVDDFIAASTANHLESVKEEGNLRFDFIQQADDPCRFMIYEAYESDEAAAAHKSTPHYLEWRNRVQDMMAEPRKGIKFNILQPSDRNKW